MNTTRREFVHAGLAGLPVLMYPSPLNAQQRGAPVRLDDPVLRHLDRELVRSLNELRSNPKRAGSLRGFESSIRFAGTYWTAQGVDQAISQALKARIDADGREAVIRAAFADDRTAKFRKSNAAARFPGVVIPEVSAPSPAMQQAEQALDALVTRGITPTLTALADQVQLLGDRADVVVRVSRAESPRSCEEMAVVVDTLQAEAAFLSAAAVWIPALAPVAGEATLMYVIAWGLYSYFC